MTSPFWHSWGGVTNGVDVRPRVPLLAEAAFAGGTERSGQNCAERVGLSAQLAVQL